LDVLTVSGAHWKSNDQKKLVVKNHQLFLGYNPKILQLYTKRRQLTNFESRENTAHCPAIPGGVTRMRVLHRGMELPRSLTGGKSTDQRKPSGRATPEHLSLQDKPGTQHCGSDPAAKKPGMAVNTFLAAKSGIRRECCLSGEIQ
jgi:hypothetical protein